MISLQVRQIDHCTLLITDIAKARHFYGTILGLSEIAPPREFNFVALWYDLGGQYLHLLLKDHADPPSARHVCLLVQDVAAARQYLRDIAINYEETVRIAAADRIFIQDPDGNRIELLQWFRPYDPNTDGHFSV